MNSPVNFRVCRACFVPEFLVHLTSLFEGNAEKAMKLKFISGIDASCDQTEYDALICDPCSYKLDEAFDLREKIQKIDKNFFVPLRIKTEIKEELIKDDTSYKVSFVEPTVEDQLRYEQIINLSAASGSEEEAAKKEEPEKEEEVAGHQKREDLDEPELKPVISKEPEFKPVISKERPEVSGTSSEGRMSMRKRKARPVKAEPEEKKTKLVADEAPIKTMKSFAHDTLNPERPYGCECGKFFKTKQELTLHQVVHSDVRPFVCPCSKAFKLKKHLIVHQKKFHNGQVEGMLSESQEEA